MRAVAVVALCCAVKGNAAAQGLQRFPLHDAAHVKRAAPVRLEANGSVSVHIEPHVSNDWKTPGRLLTAAVRFAPPTYVPSLVAYVSTDTGATWRAEALPLPRSTGFPWPGVLDPWTTVAGDGTLVVSGLLTTERGGEILVWTSADGRSWRLRGPLPRAEGGSYDHPVVVADTSQNGREIFVFANQSLGRANRGSFGNALLASKDAGSSFRHLYLLAPNTFNNQNGTSVPLRGDTVGAVWYELATTGEPRLTSPRLWWTIALRSPGRGPLSFLIREAYRGGWPVVGVSHHSGRQRILAAWIETIAVGAVAHDRVVLAVSDDGGRTWSVPRVVPLSAGAVGSPAIAVAPDGVFALSWQQRDGSCYQLLLVASRVDSVAFTAPVSLSTRWCSDSTNLAARVPLPGGATVASRWPSGGDYHGLAATRESEFVAVWVDKSTDLRRLVAARAFIVGLR